MKCTALLACEKLIIDKDGAHSIINVMLRAQISFTKNLPEQNQEQEEEIPIPANAISPNMWWIYTAWLPSSEDVGKSFEQVYQIFLPNGEKFAESRLPFTQRTDEMNQTSFYFVGFPIGQQGKVRIKTWIDMGGSMVSDIAETFVEILHGKPTHTIRPSYAMQGVISQ
jgi:hypothetical protein